MPKTIPNYQILFFPPPFFSLFSLYCFLMTHMQLGCITEGSGDHGKLPAPAFPAQPEIRLKDLRSGV